MSIYCRQAIMTKFLGPTNYRGSRVKAWCDAGQITLNWDHEIGVDENHYKAAMTLVYKLKWTEYNDWHLGALPRNYGYVLTASPRPSIKKGEVNP